MAGTFSRAQRVALETALKQKEPLMCPECGIVLTQQSVVPPANVPYVRHRVWLMCTKCRKSAAVNV
jgi:hypothetical protein